MKLFRLLPTYLSFSFPLICSMRSLSLLSECSTGSLTTSCSLLPSRMERHSVTTSAGMTWGDDGEGDTVDMEMLGRKGKFLVVVVAVAVAVAAPVHHFSDKISHAQNS